MMKGNVAKRRRRVTFVVVLCVIERAEKIERILSPAPEIGQKLDQCRPLVAGFVGKKIYRSSLIRLESNKWAHRIPCPRR